MGTWTIRQVRRVDDRVFVETKTEKDDRLTVEEDEVVEGQEAPDRDILKAWWKLPCDDLVLSGRYEVDGIVFEF